MQKNKLFLMFSIMLLFSVMCSFVQATTYIYSDELNISATHNSASSSTFILGNTNAALNVTNITCSVSGIVSSWASFSGCPTTLLNNTNSTITASVTPPKYTAPGTYTDTITVAGLLSGGAVSDTLSLNVIVGTSPSLSVVWTKPQDSMYQAESQLIEFNVTNTGNVLLLTNINVTSADLVSLNLTESLSPAESKIVNLTINTTSSTIVGSHNLKIATSGTNSTTTTANLEKSFEVYYPYCSDREEGYIILEKMLNEGDLKNEEFKPLDSFIIEVRVRNNDNDERRYGVVEAILVYEDDEVDDTKVEEKIRIDESDNEDITLTMEIPPEIEEGYHYIYIKVYDDEEEENCHQREIKIRVNKERYHVIPYEVSIDPLKVECGEQFIVKGRVVNVGSTDEEKVKIVYEDDLGNTNSKVFNDVDEGEKSSAFSFTFDVLENATEEAHTITLTANYDYDDISGDYDESSEFEYYVTVEGNCQHDVEDVSLNVQPTGYAGKELSINLNIENNGNVNTTYSVEASSSWANINSITPSDFSLNSGSSKVVIITLTPSNDVSLGSHNLEVKVNYAGKTETLSVPINVAEKSSTSTALSQNWLSGAGEKLTSNWVWIAVDIVLFLLVLGFIAYFIIRPKSAFKIFKKRKVVVPATQQVITA